jgi:integrase
VLSQTEGDDLLPHVISEWNAQRALSALEREERSGLCQRFGKAELSTAFRLYDLRHTHATLLLAKGENPKVVVERLGHSTKKRAVSE